MSVSPLALPGAFIIKPFAAEDERGIFYKTFTEDVLAKNGAASKFAEEFFSTNKRGALRGLHYQRGAASQAKLITCMRGRIFDVLVDLRKSSPTYGKHITLELSDKNMHTLFVPHGFAHGFLTLEENSLVVYRADRPYSPADERGIVYNDPKLAIRWPSAETEKPFTFLRPTPNATPSSERIIISPKDAAWPKFDEAEKFE